MRSYFGFKYVSELGVVRLREELGDSWYCVLVDGGVGYIGGIMVFICEEEEGEEEGVFLIIIKREKEKILRRKVMSFCLCLV